MMDLKNMLKLGITAFVLALMGGLATSAQHMTMDDARTQDQNWGELMKSMKAMHDAMGTAQPSGNDDEDFVNLMLPHHEAAVEMARRNCFMEMILRCAGLLRKLSPTRNPKFS